ncbi:MAG: CDP-alcohol phosphatidyltransferase family protein [SAR202 cluster bacterium]|nr:CDP-alcohol phosphatidyltransferase family protein [SAR202 cluster bacterium]
MNRDSARKALAVYFERPAARVLNALGLTPNMVTLLGLLVAGGSAYLVSQGMLLAGGIVLAASGLFDLLDGALARATGKASRFGALLDSVSDRVAEAGLLLGALIFYAASANTVGMALSFAAFAGSFMVSYLRARAEGLGIECKAGLMTRPERVATLAVALVVAQWWTPMLVIALGVISGLTIFTSLQRLLLVRRELQRLDG